MLTAFKKSRESGLISAEIEQLPWYQFHPSSESYKERLGLISEIRGPPPWPTVRDRERPRSIKLYRCQWCYHSLLSLLLVYLAVATVLGVHVQFRPTPPHSNILPFEHERRSSSSPAPQLNITTTNGSSQHHPPSAHRAPGLPNKL